MPYNLLCVYFDRLFDVIKLLKKKINLWTGVNLLAETIRFWASWYLATSTIFTMRSQRLKYFHRRLIFFLSVNCTAWSSLQETDNERQRGDHNHLITCAEDPRIQIYHLERQRLSGIAKVVELQKWRITKHIKLIYERGKKSLAFGYHITHTFNMRIQLSQERSHVSDTTWNVYF